jgi:hypothetical protein
MSGDFEQRRWGWRRCHIAGMLLITRQSLLLTAYSLLLTLEGDAFKQAGPDGS